MKARTRKLRDGVLLGLGATLVAGVLWWSGALEGWENTTWDWRMRQVASADARALAESRAIGDGVTVATAAADSICVILLDQASLVWGRQTNGWSWPWPREVYTAIIDFCRRGGARSFGCDVLFTEPSVYGVWDDEALGGAITDMGRFVGAVFVHESVGEEDGGLTVPIPEVADNARMLANVSGRPDGDGVFRRATLWHERDDRLIAGLGLALYGLGADAAGDMAGLVSTLPQRPILRFADPEHTWPTYSAAAIIQSDLQLREGAVPTLEPTVVRGRHVLFGFSAPGLMDLRPTPLSRVSPGVTVHGTVLANLLADGFIRPVPSVVVLVFLLIAATALAVAVLLANRVWLTATVLVFGLLASALAGMLLARSGWWWPVIPGTVGTGLAMAGAMVLAWATEGRQKRFIRQAFRHYLSPHVIERIVADPDRLRLGGERRELTIFFSDLEGFTTISEGLEPEDLATLLNEYLTDMTDIILAEGGTLDKYEGDAIIAFWNAPVDQPDHARRGCRAAVLCQQRLAIRRAEFAERFGVEMKMRIGLHTGPVTVGNMGSRQRFDYTVLGDAANLAARLEGANKVFGTYLMVSATTRIGAGDEVRSRELGTLRVVGRSEPVVVHELGGLRGDEEPADWPEFARGLERCVAGEAAAARELFSGLPDDAAARAWTVRLATETEGFDPVWNLTRK